ncbi:hypothetical protein [Aquipseudomonas campi]
MIIDGYRLIAYGVLAVVCTGAGWQIRDWQADSAALVELRNAEERRDLVAEVANATHQAIAGIRVENKTIYQKAVHETFTDVVYRECRIPAAGVRLINEARGYRSGADAGVPGSAASAGGK